MTDISDLGIHVKPTAPHGIFEGDDLVLRTAQRVIGCAFMLAGLGLWVLPGSNWAAELAIMKLGLSVFFAMFGYAVWQIGRMRPR